MAIQSYQDIIAWQKAKTFTVMIYQEFGSCRDYGYGDQIQRALVSIMNNIAEGYARGGSKSFKNYLLIAKGSAAEVESMLQIAVELKYLTEEKQKALLAQIAEILKLLTGFIKSL